MAKKLIQHSLPPLVYTFGTVYIVLDFMRTITDFKVASLIC